MAEKNGKLSNSFGFDQSTIGDRLKKFDKYEPDGKWQRHREYEVVMTIITQKWPYVPTGMSLIVKHICPWGMKEHQGRSLISPKVKRWEVIPSERKNSSGDLMKKETYVPAKWEVSVGNSGAQQSRRYHRLCCNHCESQILPMVLN